jgi:hypothetical protein
MIYVITTFPVNRKRIVRDIPADVIRVRDKALMRQIVNGLLEGSKKQRKIIIESVSEEQAKKPKGSVVQLVRSA